MAGKSDLRKKLEDLIKKHGWAVQSVLSDGVTPGFSYSIGMSDKNLPEILLVGLNPTLSQNLVNDICQRLVDGTIHGKHGEIIEEMVNFPLRLRSLDTIDVQHIMLGALRHVSDGRAIKVIQIIYPDEKGIYPEDKRCNPDIAHLQSLAAFNATKH